MISWWWDKDFPTILWKLIDQRLWILKSLSHSRAFRLVVNESLIVFRLSFVHESWVVRLKCTKPQFSSRLEWEIPKPQVVLPRKYTFVIYSNLFYHVLRWIVECNVVNAVLAHIECRLSVFVTSPHTDLLNLSHECFSEWKAFEYCHVLPHKLINDQFNREYFHRNATFGELIYHSASNFHWNRKKQVLFKGFSLTQNCWFKKPRRERSGNFFVLE